MQRNRAFATGNNPFSPRLGNQKSYSTQLSGAKRHQFDALPTPVPAGYPAVAANEYVVHVLTTFARTFTGADDTPGTPTASNNYATSLVMNGSRIQNMQAKLTIRNRTNIGGFISLYRVALSFYDALLFNSIISTSCPVTFDSTTTGPPNHQGTVLPKAVSTTLILRANYNNYKTVQKYMEYLGDILLGTEDTDSGQVEIQLNGQPPQCVRSQTGMFYAYFLVNDTTKNGGESLTFDSTIGVSFEEVPSDNRLPYVV